MKGKRAISCAAKIIFPIAAKVCHKLINNYLSTVEMK
jgi:hypothetical protein